MKLDPDARYATTHEWARPEGDLFVCGISDHAQDSLSDVVFVDLPQVGSNLAKGAVFGVVESVKSASDLNMPIGGEIVAINEQIVETPEAINDDPYGQGWLIKIKPNDPSEWDSLLTGEQYERGIESGEIED